MRVRLLSILCHICFLGQDVRVLGCREYVCSRHAQGGLNIHVGRLSLQPCPKPLVLYAPGPTFAHPAQPKNRPPSFQSSIRTEREPMNPPPEHADHLATHRKRPWHSVAISFSIKPPFNFMSKMSAEIFPERAPTNSLPNPEISTPSNAREAFYFRMLFVSPPALAMPQNPPPPILLHPTALVV